jgi:hypothetical protein
MFSMSLPKALLRSSVPNRRTITLMRRRRGYDRGADVLAIVDEAIELRHDQRVTIADLPEQLNELQSLGR